MRAKESSEQGRTERANRAAFRLLPGAYFGWAMECTLNPEHPALCDHTLSRGRCPRSNERPSPTPRTFAEITESCGNGLGCVRLPSSLATVVVGVLAGTYASSTLPPLPGDPFDRRRAFPATFAVCARGLACRW